MIIDGMFQRLSFLEIQNLITSQIQTQCVIEIDKIGIAAGFDQLIMEIRYRVFSLASRAGRRDEVFLIEFFNS